MAGKVFYNKLVRDNIPEVIAAAGSQCETYELSEAEYEVALIKKVEEEAAGVLAATNREELIAELADLEDVLEEIKTFQAIQEEELRAMKEKAFKKKGGFTKRLFLVWSSEDGYVTNESKQ